MFKKYLENRIICHKGDYKCYLCHYEIKKSFDLVEEHLVTDKHKQRLNQVVAKQRTNESELLTEFSESQLRVIVENRITFDKGSTSFYCHVCKCVTSELYNTVEHIRDVPHQIALKKFETQRSILANKKLCNNSTGIQDTKLQSESNCITSERKTYSYYCNTCNSNITQNKHELLHQVSELELKNSTSNLKLDYIIYDEKCNLYHCTICTCSISGSPNVLEHIQGFLHLTLLNTQNVLETKQIQVPRQEFSSQIIFDTQQPLRTKKVESSNQGAVSSSQQAALQENSLASCFSEISYCNTCHACLEDNAETQYHIMLHLLKKFELFNNLDILEFACESDGKCYLKCLLCDYYCVSTMSDAHKFLKVHLKTEKHLERSTFFQFTKRDSGLENMNVPINSLELNKFACKTIDSISPWLLCNICNVPVHPGNHNPSRHAAGRNHNKKLIKIKNGAVNEKKTVLEPKDNNYYKCFTCDEAFDHASILFDHYKMPKHKWKIEALKMITKCTYTQFQKTSGTEIITCLLCDTPSFDFLSAMEHIKGKKHSQKLKLTSINQNNQECTITSLVTNQLDNLSVDPGPKLTRKSKTDTACINNQNSPITTTKNLKIIKKSGNLKTSVQEPNHTGFDTKTTELLPPLKPEIVANTLNDLIPVDYSNSQFQKLPSSAKTKSPDTPKVEVQKNSFATDVLLYGQHYIKFCIDPGLEYVYNLDNEKISLLKLGVQLTMPYYSDRVCLPCGQQFSDNFQLLFEHLHKQEHLNNIYEMQVDDNNFENYPEQFSDLKLAKSYMHVSDKSVECYACNIQIDDNDGVIRQHVEESVHKEKSKLWKEESEQLFNQYFEICKDIWYYAQFFYCEVCKKSSKSEMNFVKHLIHAEHIRKVNKLKDKKVDLAFDLCHSCMTHWFGNTNSYDTHCKNDFHKRFTKKKNCMIPKLTSTASEFLNNIEVNIDLLENESNKAILGKDNETALLQDVVKTVESVYPSAAAYIFGSRLSHLGFPNSDVDVFLDLENVCYTNTALDSTQKRSQQYIMVVINYFENASKTWIVDDVLIHTRVPIIKLRHRPTNLKCDISFLNRLSIEKSELVGLYITAFPICRKMILFMKKWLSFCGIFGSDYITTFAITWFIIFYLQVEGILPTVYELIKRKQQSKLINGWQCGFDEKFTAKNSSISFREYLKGFFTYFANFDYKKSVICPYLGKPIDKHVFASEYTDLLPTEMNIYRDRLEKKEIEIFRFESPMCIQDPVDLSQNITKALRKQDLRCFRQYCTLSADKCQC